MSILLAISSSSIIRSLKSECIELRSESKSESTKWISVLYVTGYCAILTEYNIFWIVVIFNWWKCMFLWYRIWISFKEIKANSQVGFLHKKYQPKLTDFCCCRAIGVLICFLLQLFGSQTFAIKNYVLWFWDSKAEFD